MAGIGFELKKLFAGRGMIMKIRAYAYASIVCSGTMLLAIVLLLGVQSIANVSGVSEVERERLVVMMVYAMLLSLLLTSGLQMLLSRYVADQLYQDSPERVLPSLFGASLLIMVPGGVLYALFLAQAPEIALVDRALNWLLFMLLIPCMAADVLHHRRKGLQAHPVCIRAGNRCGAWFGLLLHRPWPARDHFPYGGDGHWLRHYAGGLYAGPFAILSRWKRKSVRFYGMV